MIKFEKIFGVRPTPTYQTEMGDLFDWKLKREGWFAALKWIISVGKEHGTISAFDTMADEIEELEESK